MTDATHTATFSPDTGADVARPLGSLHTLVHHRDVTGDPDGYLRAYDEDVDGALELVVRDLVTAGIDRVEAEAVVRDRAEYLLSWNDVRAGGEIALRVLDALQDDMLEERDDHVWPRCPEHGTHPLWIDSWDPTAMWTCMTTGRAFARLGELAGGSE